VVNNRHFVLEKKAYFVHPFIGIGLNPRWQVFIWKWNLVTHSQASHLLVARARVAGVVCKDAKDSDPPDSGKAAARATASRYQKTPNPYHALPPRQFQVPSSFVSFSSFRLSLAICPVASFTTPDFNPHLFDRSHPKPDLTLSEWRRLKSSSAAAASPALP
jgi:hypothetical protein